MFNLKKAKTICMWPTALHSYEHTNVRYIAFYAYNIKERHTAINLYIYVTFS